MSIESEVVDSVIGNITYPIAGGVSGAILFGLSLEYWVLIGTAILLTVNLGTKTYNGIKLCIKLYKDYRSK